jgi:sulfotransferase
MKKIHFLGGLPRSGSTVLLNILQQNSSVFTTSSDPLPAGVHKHILQNFRVTERFLSMSVEDADCALYGMTMGAIDGWYNGLTKKPIVISKAREWNRIHHLLPDSKKIILVRDLRDVVESFDKINFKLKALHSFEKEGTALYAAMTEMQKFNYYFNTPTALSATLKEELPAAMEFWEHEGKKDSIKFVRFEDFVRDPIQTLSDIANFLDIPDYAYDINNISQSSMYEHDNSYYSERTDHKTKPVFIKNHKTTRRLSNRIHFRILDEYRWFYEAFYPEEL